MIARLRNLIIAVLAGVAALWGLFGWGRRRGEQHAREQAIEERLTSEQRAATAERTVHSITTRTEVDTDVLHLPAGDTTPVADAADDTAAGRLRDEWSRD
jgi:hypothetical protein